MGCIWKKKASDVPDSCISISKINPTQSEDQWYDMSDASLWCHQEAQLMDGVKTSNNHDHLNIRLMMAKFLIWTKIPLYGWGLQPHVNHLLELEAHMKIIRFLFFHTLISALLHFWGSNINLKIQLILFTDSHQEMVVALSAILSPNQYKCLSCYCAITVIVNNGSGLMFVR